MKYCTKILGFDSPSARPIHMNNKIPSNILTKIRQRCILEHKRANLEITDLCNIFNFQLHAPILVRYKIDHISYILLFNIISQNFTSVHFKWRFHSIANETKRVKRMKEKPYCGIIHNSTDNPSMREVTK